MPIMVVNGAGVLRYNNSAQMTGEKIAGDLRSWDYFGTDPNELLTYTYNILSERATTLYHTHPPVNAGVNKLTHYAIGPGLVFRSQPDWQTLGIDQVYAKEWGMRFQKLIHYMFTLLNYYEKQNTLFRTSLIMGDSLLMFDRTYDEDGLPFDLIETGGDQINFEQNITSNNNPSTLGIVHDKMLRRKGFYQVGKGDPVMFRDENGDQNAIQYFEKKIARQLRGYPLAYSIIAVAKNNDRLWDAIVQRAVMETIILGSTESDSDDLYKQADYLADNAREETRESGSSLQTEGNAKDLGVGNIFSFKKGGIKFTDLKTPSNNFDKMQSAFIEYVGMAMDIPAEVLLSKYSTSFTAHKGALNDFIKSFMFKRKGFINSVNKVVVKEIAKYLFMENLIEMPNPKFFTNPIIQEATIAGNWLGPVPGHINPLQEVNAKILEVENSFKTRADAAADYGNEFDDIIEEWKEQEKEFRSISPDNQAAILDDDLNDEEDDENEDDND